MSNPIYTSIFKNEFRELVELKRALGFKYEAEAQAFKRIDTFFNEIGLENKSITKEVSDKWCKKRSYESHANHARRISNLRIFCKHVSSIGLPTFIPPKGMVKHPPKYDAHIYTDDELKRFFVEVDKSQSVPSECPYRGEVMPIFFRILYTSGMRVSELRLAKLSDVNLDKGYIIIDEGKNHKERIVPIHPSLLSKCIELKNKIHLTSPDDEYFFMIRPGQAMPLVNVYKNFRRYLEKAGISHTGRGPRVHDFRHTYCINLLRKWTDEEKDLLAYLPYMRTMLGHEGFEETAYYLKLTVDRFPYIKEKLQSSFPNIIEEVNFDEREFY